PLFNFPIIRHIYQLRAIERQKTRKFRLSTYKMNFLFKKILRNILKVKDSGSLVVRFLQPYGLLLSLQKLRKISKGIRTLTRYRRQISFKRLLPYMSILVRY
ncbi:MAG TPA: hypothetical protein VN704_03100, partial [Verrucomicrobiae bacterium]|nr:hypothetical protein [Verrucomicrobiae bacterium]